MAEEILTYIKSPRNGSVCYFSSKLDVPSNVVQKKRVARILFFKIRPSQEILKIPDGTPLEAEEILTYIKCPRNGSVCYFYSKLDVSSNVVQNKKVARILFFKIRSSQGILKIRDGAPIAEEILTYIKSPRNGSVCYFSSKLDVPSNVVQKKRVARILFFKIRPSQEILKIRDGTPLEAEEILTYIKCPRNGSVCYFYSKLDVSSNVVQNKKVARILFFKIRSSQGILKIRGGNFDIHKSPRNGSVCYFSSKLDVPSNVVQKKRVARILFYKIRPSQEILKIRDGTPLEAEEILTYIKCPRNGSVCYFYSKLDVSSNVVQKKKVARILFFKITSSQGILKIRDGTPMEAEEILTYIKSPRNGSVCYFSSKLDVPSNVVQKKRVARILFFKIRPSQEILKIRDGTPLEAEEILTYIKCPRNGSVCYFYSKLDVSSNVVQKKKVARILFFKIRSSQGILKIRDDVPSNVVQKKRVARILFFKIWSSQGILKVRDCTPMEAEEILTYIKSPRNGSVCYFSSKLDVPSNVVQKKRVARILFFKIRQSQEILKIRDGTLLEAEEILTYIKCPRNGSVCYFYSKLDVSSNVVQKKKVARILFFKIRSSQEILEIRDGALMELDVPSNVVHKKRVARILFFKIWSSQGILKVRDCTPMEEEEILTYIKSPRNGSVCYFSSKLDVPSNVVQNKRVARILFFKIRSSQGILKIRDGAPMEAEEILTYIKSPRNGSVCYFSSKLDVPSNVVQKKRVARILFFKIRPSQEILKIRDGTPLEAEEILTYIKCPRNGSVCYFYSKLDVSSNVVQNKKVARILFFKIRSSQGILKIRDGAPIAEEILTYIKSPRNGSVCYFSSKLDVPSNVVQKKRVARILFFKIRPSQEILKIRDGTPLEAEEILTYIKCPRNGSVCYFYSKLDVSSNVVQNKKVARILFFKIRSSQGILKIRDGAPIVAEEILTYIKSPRNGSVCYFSSKLDVPSNVVQKKRVARILFFKIRPSQEILKIRDGTPLEAEEILTYIKCPRNGSVCYFYSKLDVSSNVVQKKKVARILFFKIRSSQGILKIRDDVPSNVVQKKRVARILFFKIWSSQGILKVRDCTPMEAEEILTYIKSPRNGSVCYFSSKLDVPSNVVQKKRVARILFFKIRQSQEILKIRDGTLLEAEEILTYIKCPRNGSVCYFYSKLDVSSNVVQKKKVARILFFKIRSSQEILEIRDGALMELDVPSNVVHKKRVARILFFKIWSSQGILKVRDCTPMEEEEILTYIKSPRNGSVCYFSSKLDVPSNVVQNKRVARILFFKIRSSQGILKIRDGAPMEAEEILTYIKSPRNGSVCYFSSKLDVPSNVVQKKRVARILFFKIRPSQEILKIRDGTPLEAEEILTYIKCPRNGSVCYFYSKLDVSSNVVQNKKVARILFFKIRSSQGILKIRDGAPIAEEILTYIKSPRNGSVCYFSSKLDVPSNVVQKKRVARILFFKIRPSQEILKIRDGTPLEAEEILTYIKCPRNGSVCYFYSKLDVSSNVVQKKKVARILFFKISKLDVPSNVVQKKRVARILFFKIWSSQGILNVRDCTPMEAEEILTYIKSPRNGSVCYFSSKLDVPSNVVQKKRVARILFFKIRQSQEILKIRDGTLLEAEEILTYIKCPRNGSVCYFYSKLDVSSNVVQKKKVARILFFKIRSSQEILEIRDGALMELDVPSNVVHKKRVARILFFKIWSSQGILKVRDCTPMEEEEILTYIKSPRNGSVCYFSSKLDVPSNVVQNKRVARILFFKIRSSQGILKIRDGAPMEAEEILTYIKSPRNGSVCYFSSKLDVPSNVVQKKRVARILFFKIRPSQEILKIRDGTPLEAEEILTYIKCPRNGSVCYFYSKLDVSSNVVQNKKVARILFFKIRSSQGILKIRDGTPMEAEEILTYIKSPRNGSVCYFSSKLDVPSNVVQKKRVARILFFKIRPSQEILKIRDGTPLEAEEILTYIKCPRNGSVCYFYSKLDVSSNVVQKKKVARILFFKIRSSQGILKIHVPSNVVQKKRVARILFFKIWSSQGILKVRDCTPMEAEEILTYIKSPRNGSVCYFSSKLDVPSNVVQKKRVARILFFKIRQSQEILKIRDGTLLEAGEILTYIKCPRNGSVCYFYSKLDVSSNVVQKKKVARILFFKIRSSQEILEIRDGALMELDVPSNVVHKKRVARILFFKIWSSQGILKVRDCTPMEEEEILTYIKSPRNGSVCYFSSKLDVPSNVVQNKRVARILFFKIRSSQGILKIRDGAPMEAEEILTYIKSPRNGSVCYFSSKLDVPSNVVQKKRVARILFFKIRPSQEILKIRDGTPLEAEEILTYIKCPRNGSVCYFYSKLDVSSNVVQKKKVARILFFKISKLDVPSNVVQKKRVARILFFKIWSSQGILKVRDCTPMEAEEILTYIKSPRNGSVCYFSSKLDVPSNVVQKKRVARIMFYKIRPSQEIIKIRDGTPLELDVPSNVVQKKRVARILFFKIRPSQEILQIRDGTPLEAEEILTYIKCPRNGSVCYFYSKLDVSSNVVQKKKVARILFFKIRSSQGILKIRDGAPMELDVPSNVVQKKRVARILFFKIWSSQGILKVRDCTPMEAEEILTYIKSPRNGSVCYFSSKLDVPSNVVQKKRVARILFYKIRPSQEIIKIRDGTPLELDVPSNVVQKKRVARILFFKIRPSQEILQIRDGTPLEAEEILTYIKCPRNGSVCYFYSKLDVSSNVVQKKKVARILFFKIRSSQGILKIRDGAPMELDVPSNVVQNKRVARILFYKIRPSQEILKIRDGTPLEAEEILTYIKALETDRVARVLFFKIRPSQEILKIRDGTPLEAEEILTYIKCPRNGSVCYFYSKLDVSTNVVQKKKVARILFFKIRSSQGILKIRDDVPSNVVQKKRVARILFFKIWSSQGILKVRDCTPMEAEEILTYIKSPRNGSVCYFSSKLDVPSNVVQKKRVARILFYKIRPSQEILKIRDGTPLELDVPSNVVQKKRVARILFFKIRPSQEILQIRDGTPLEAEEILTYIKCPRNGSVCYFYSKLDVSSNVVQKKKVARILFFKIRSSQGILKIRDGAPMEMPSQEILKIRDGTPLEAEEILTNIKALETDRVARILFFKIRPSQEILKIRDGTPLEVEEILTYIKCPRNGSVCYFYSKLDVSSNVVQKKKVARILFFKIRSSQGILKIRDGAPILCLDVPSNVVQKKRVARILFFKIWSSQGILKVRDGTPLEAEEILTYIKCPRNGSVCYFYSKLDVSTNVVQKKKVARILFFKIRSSQGILKIRDGAPINVVQKKRVARILFFKIWSSQGILKVRDCTPMEAEEILTYIKALETDRVARILFYKIRPSQVILKIRDGTPLEAEEILTYIKCPRNGSVCYFYSKLDVSSNVVQKKKVARILFFKITSSQGILKIRDGTPMELDVPSNVVQKKRVARILFFKIRPSQEILKIRDDVPSNVVQKKRVARILFFKIRPSQEILQIRDGTPLEAEEILTYIKCPRNGSVCYFYSKLDVSSNVVQKKKVARILFFKIRSSQGILKIRDGAPMEMPSQEILKIRDGTPLEAEEILTYIKALETDRVARILFFKIRPSQEILKIRDGTPLEAEEILTYIKCPRNGSVCYFYSKLDVSSNVVQKKKVARILFFKIRSSQGILKIRDDVPSNVVQKKRVARILFFKIWSSQGILKVRDGTPLEAEEILTYIKCPRNGSVCYFYSKLDVSTNVVQKKKVARILFFKIRSSQGILKIRDGAPIKEWHGFCGGNFDIHKSPRNGSVCYFSSKLDVPSNVVQKKRVARILFYKIRPSQEILKIRDGTPLEAEEILTYIKCPRNGSVCYFYSKLDVSSNVVQKKKVARILFFKITSSQGILKIRDGTPMEAEEILTYIKSPRNGSVCYFSSKLDVPSNVVQKKRVARILFFKIRPSQEILKIRDGTPLEAEEILTYIKCPRNGSVCYFYSKLDVSSNVVQKKKVARILFFKIRSSQGILKIRDGAPIKLDVPSNVVQKKRVARILFFKIWSSQGILKVRDCTPMEAEEILTYIKSPRNGSVCYFSSKLDVPSNVVQKKRVARILYYKIRPSQEIIKICDGTPLELDVPSNVVQKKRVARILFFKIRPSQEILQIRDGTPLEAEEILTYIKCPRNGSVCYFYSKLDVSSNVVQKKKVARILFFKIRSSQGILKIRDGAPMENKRVARILFYKIRPSQEILKIRDGTPLEAEEILTYIKALETDRVARILFFKIRPSQEILKIRDGTPLEAEEILTYIKCPRNGSVCYFYSKLDVSTNVVQKKKVARILFFKIRSSQGILKIRDGAPIKLDVPSNVVQKKRVARILFFKIWSSQGILKVRDCTPMEAEEILTYIKSPRNGSVCYFSSKLDVPSNVVQKKRVARILFYKIRPSQEILKIRDGTPLELDVPSNVVQKKRVARILFFKIRPSQEILQIRDGTPLEAEEILTYIKCPRNGSVCYFYSKLDVSSNVVQKKKVARILFFKIRSSQGILKIHLDVPSNVVQKKRVARILFFKIWSSQGILKVRDCTPMEAEEILTYIKSPRNGSVCYFSSKLDVPSNVVQKKRVARILFYKIRPSQEILKIRDGTPLELDVPSNVVQKKRVARILFFKIRPSQEILKIRDGTPLEAEEILTYIKSPRNGSVCYFSSKLDVSSNVVQKKKVARILFFKIRSSQGILKIRDGAPMECKLDVPSNVVHKKRVARILFFKIWSSQGILKVRDCTPMEEEEILTYIKSPRNGSVCYFSSKLDVPSNVVQNKRVARILFFKIRSSQGILKIRDGAPMEAKLDVPSNVVQKKRVARILFFKIRQSQEILKIRDGTLLEAEEILTYIKCPRNRSVCYFYSKLDVSSNVVQKKKVARILFFKIRSSQGILEIRDGTPMEMQSQEILKIRDGTPLEAEEILTYIKCPRNGSLDVPSNVVQKKRVARILFFKIRQSQEILKIRDGTLLEAEEILTYIKCPRNGSVCYFYSKLDVSSNVVQKKKVARILFFKIRSSQGILEIRDEQSQEILKIRDGTPLEAEEILTYIKCPRNGSVYKLDVPSNVVQKKRVARILFFKIRQSQEILKIRDGTLLEAEEILTYIKCPRNGSVCYFYSKLDVSSNVVQKKKVARILFFKIRSSQGILEIRDGALMELDVPSNVVHKKRVARILFFKIWSSQGILKVRDCTPMEEEEILTYIKSPRNGSVCYFSSKLDVPSNVVQNKRVARILFFKIRSSQGILKIRDGAPMEAE
ncbi:hypothetical protein OROMI_024937 [Orobanche minor]